MFFKVALGRGPMSAATRRCVPALRSARIPKLQYWVDTARDGTADGGAVPLHGKHGHPIHKQISKSLL